MFLTMKPGQGLPEYMTYVATGDNFQGTTAHPRLETGQSFTFSIVPLLKRLHAVLTSNNLIREL